MFAEQFPSSNFSGAVFDGGRLGAASRRENRFCNNGFVCNNPLRVLVYFIGYLQSLFTRVGDVSHGQIFNNLWCIVVHFIGYHRLLRKGVLLQNKIPAHPDFVKNLSCISGYFICHLPSFNSFLNGGGCAYPKFSLATSLSVCSPNTTHCSSNIFK